MADTLYRPAAEVRDGMPVTCRDEFSALERPAGWKYEWWDNRLRIEPDWRYHVARWVGPPTGQVPTPAGVSIQHATASHLGDLTETADIAFADGPDFFRWPALKRRESLRQSVADALTREPDWVRAAHRLARDDDGVAVGLLLVREVEGGVTLETVGVHPGWRRSGLATLMFESAMDALPDETDVRSAWLIANRESEAWHQRVGFETVLTSVAVRSQSRGDMWRRQLSILSDEGRAAEAEIRRLEEAEREGRAPNPFTFAQPIHRRPSA